MLKYQQTQSSALLPAGAFPKLTHSPSWSLLINGCFGSTITAFAEHGQHMALY